MAGGEQVTKDGQLATAVSVQEGEMIYAGGTTDGTCIVKTTGGAQRAQKVFVVGGESASGGTGIEAYMTNEFGFDVNKTQVFKHMEGTPVWEDEEPSATAEDLVITEYTLVITGSGDMNLIPVTDNIMAPKALPGVLNCTHGSISYSLPFILYTRNSISGMTIAMSQTITGDFGSGYKVFYRYRNGATWGEWTLAN